MDYENVVSIKGGLRAYREATESPEAEDVMGLLALNRVLNIRR